MVGKLFQFALRGVFGFVAGYIVACGALLLLGLLPAHGDLDQVGLNARAHWHSIAAAIHALVRRNERRSGRRSTQRETRNAI